ncbi:D-alanyl-D-alanine carboxypeptidase/D-alanyl-D-alanine endopeptidase [Pedobacter arcticus]|uniref:D-alanyl-D-alanine carboxypeptidase/D-alanyl-D-alanine endopeptidase n=1 Tax=Pedobacter arcticus TaxID=752140 RepID=UPI0004744A2E|nr:D-alanyl-D-alanine carboxypeptidase/D-alanyl-D-alanine-endopeptidase [Pedobacter arcticus]
MKKLALLLLISSSVLNIVTAQNLASKLEVAYARFSANQQLKYATVSFSVIDNKSGKVLFSKNGNTGLAPASTLKVITAATALDLLGEDFTFKTNVFYRGEIRNGTLNGDLIIKGSGDPTLGSDRWDKTKKSQILNKILFNLQQKGINRITGYVIGDASAWDTQTLPIGWIWQDMGNYYGAGTSALCWGENYFELGFSPGKTAGAPVKTNTKNYPFLEITNELTTGASGSGDQVYAYSAPYSSDVFLRGTYGIDLKKQIGVALPNPPLAMAFDVAQFLQTNGYGSEEFKAQILPADAKDHQLLFSISSPPLSEIIYWFNQKSINLYGEQLVRVIGEKSGKNPSTIEGIKVINDYWEKKGIDPDALRILDGSGLSPSDRVTTLAMAKVLSFSRSKPWFNSYLKSIPLYNNQKMKSGTIANVLAYSGFSGNGNEISFSLMVNNYSESTGQMRQKMYEFLNALK